MQVRSLGRKVPLEKEIRPTPVFLPKNPIQKGAWTVMVHEVSKELDTTE